LNPRPELVGIGHVTYLQMQTVPVSPRYRVVFMISEPNLMHVLPGALEKG